MHTLEQQTDVDQQMLNEIYLASRLMQEPESPVLETNITFDEILSSQLDANVWLAQELHQPIGAHKIRGAYNFFQNMTSEEMGRGVVTASAGNHSQGIAMISHRMGIRSSVFMPKCTPSNKVERAAELGGQFTRIYLVGNNFDESQEHAQQYAQETGGVFASPFNDRRVIAGQGTWGLEIAEALSDIDLVFCPVGGMGTLAGIATAIMARQPGAEIVAVEPKSAASLSLAYELGKPYPLPEIDTFVDGAAVKKVGEIPFKIASHLVSEVVTVSNLEVRRATTSLRERKTPILAELAGSMSVGGLLNKFAEEIKGKTAVCMISGGNLRRDRYEREVKL